MDYMDKKTGRSTDVDQHHPRSSRCRPSMLPPLPCPSSRCRTWCCFPNVFLPLHIFEPRYRQMVADALAGRPG
jgi:hypothetical protein